MGEVIGSSFSGLAGAFLGELTGAIRGLSGGGGAARFDDVLVGIVPGETCHCNHRCACDAKCKGVVDLKAKKLCIDRCMADTTVCPG